MHASPSEHGSGSPSDALLKPHQKVRYTLRDIYDAYDRTLMLTERRVGAKVRFFSDDATHRSVSSRVDHNGRTFQLPTDDSLTAASQRDMVCSDVEEQYAALHASRILFELNEVLFAVKELGASTTTAPDLPPHLLPHGHQHRGHHAAPPPTQQQPQHHHHHHQQQDKAVSACDTSVDDLGRKPGVLSKVARLRLGRKLADIILSCSAIGAAVGFSRTSGLSTAAGISSTEDPMTAVQEEFVPNYALGSHRLPSSLLGRDRKGVPVSTKSSVRMSSPMAVGAGDAALYEHDSAFDVVFPTFEPYSNEDLVSLDHNPGPAYCDSRCSPAGSGVPHVSPRGTQGAKYASGRHPMSPASSVFFKPALSFTSVDSVRYIPPASYGFGGAFSTIGFHPPVYAVDEPKVLQFFRTLKEVKRIVADPRTTEKEFADIGLRFVVPGISCGMSSSASPACQLPPILAVTSDDSSLPIGLASESVSSGSPVLGVSAPVAGITSATSFLFLPNASSFPPKAPSTEAVDAGRVSRVSSISTRRNSVNPFRVPDSHGLQLFDGGYSRYVTLNEFPIFLAALHKALIEVDAGTGGQFRLTEKFLEL